MIVSWEWLQEYVDLKASVDEVTHRLTMSGLNLEGVDARGDDTAVDLEVTSNRPDCLGHIGLCRQAFFLRCPRAPLVLSRRVIHRAFFLIRIAVTGDCVTIEQLVHVFSFANFAKNV